MNKEVCTINYGGEYMKLWDDGCITRPTIFNTPSGNWKVQGAVEFTNFGYIVRRYSLETIINDPASIPWKYKNGKQRVHIVDYDHGSTRVWMSPTHSIWKG